MSLIGRILVSILFLALAGLIAGCVTTVPVATERSEAQDLDATIEALGKDLAQQLTQTGQIALLGKKQVLVDRFVDSQTGQVNAAYRIITDRLPAVIAKHAGGFTFRSMQGKEVADADYVLTGSVALETRSEKSKDYRIYASITELKSGMVIANARVWLQASRELDLAPEPVYGDSPMYLSDKATQALVTTTKTLPGALADATYLAQLTTSALLNEAEAAYNRNELALAAQLYNEAASRADGKVMRTYSGLYLVYQKAGSQELAEQAFADLVDLGLVARQISVKFLFKVNSTSFVDDLRQTGQYPMWLRQIALRASAHQVCLEVSGHTSRSGSEATNNRLSLQRAEVIMRSLIQHASAMQGRLRAVGRGSRDNIIGTGTDDSRDAIDRRVDFKIVPC